MPPNGVHQAAAALPAQSRSIRVSGEDIHNRLGAPHTCATMLLGSTGSNPLGHMVAPCQRIDAVALDGALHVARCTLHGVCCRCNCLQVDAVALDHDLPELFEDVRSAHPHLPPPHTVCTRAAKPRATDPRCVR